jgi:hypothetical protein
VRILGTLITPTAGSAVIAGIALSPASGAEIRQHISIMPEAPGLYRRADGHQTLFSRSLAVTTAVPLARPDQLTPVLVPATMSAFSVVGEREQGTLEPVLTTPVSRSELLTGKARNTGQIPIQVDTASRLSRFPSEPLACTNIPNGRAEPEGA